MEPFLGQICMFGFDFAPRDWAKCDGQMMAISSNEALFSLLGTMYGGDGRRTFALPDLRGRVALHQGRHPGSGFDHRVGSITGTESNVLNVNNLPAHNHTLGTNAFVRLSDDVGDKSIGNDRAFSVSPSTAAGAVGDKIFDKDPTFANGNKLHNGTVGGMTENNSTPNHGVNNMQPSTTVNICIALQGIFPSRS